MDPLQELKQAIEEIEKKLSYSFNDKNLLMLAFVHKSYSNEHRELIDFNNERLEFLGDSVLGLIMTEYLYRAFPDFQEGKLSELRSSAVDLKKCALYLKQLDVEKWLLIGAGEKLNAGRGRDTLLADLLEAIIGAIYLDGGFLRAQEFFLTHFQGLVKMGMEQPSRNWKADLQDYLQKKFKKAPTYIVENDWGPEHAKTFLVAAMLDGEHLGSGEGSSKKEAEQAAAKSAIEKLGI